MTDTLKTSSADAFEEYLDRQKIFSMILQNLPDEIAKCS
jgi:hypothetical protein